MTVGRYRFDETIKALLEYPTADRGACAELAEALAITQDLHVPERQDADVRGYYGLCRGCGQLWPCRTWGEAAYTATGWLVAASNAVMRRSGTVGPALPVAGRVPPDVELLECYRCGGDCREYPGWRGHQARIGD